MTIRSGPPGVPRLWGREAECAVLDDVLASVRRGESRSLLLRGEAGIGKTALLSHLVANAEGMVVARATGVQSEMELAFASLHQICAPMLEALDELPLPQREALQVVFGLSTGAAPDRFLVGLAILSLLSEVAERRPLLCVVDDAQWLDRSSALTLAFVTRRLLAEPVALVFAAREPAPELRHVPDLQVHGLADGDARALLDSAVTFRLDERIRDRIIAETRGNPLALVELPRGLTPTELAGGLAIPEVPDVSERIESTFIRRVEGLPADARRVMLLAAAEPVGDPLLLQRACEQLNIPQDAVDGADGLMTVGEVVVFRHPLARSAVYRSAGPAERRAAHRALAHATDPRVDPDRRAWHLAAAATGPDEDVAHELERSADRAQARGGYAAAAAFLRRAVALTAEPPRRADRSLAAAQASLAAGAFDSAHRLVADAAAGPLDELGRARAGRLGAEIAYARQRGGDAPLLLLRAAQQLDGLDARLARDTYLDAWAAGLFAGRLASPGGRLSDISRAVAAAARPSAPRRASDALLEGLALIFTAGRSRATPALAEAVASFDGADATADELLRWGWLATRAANVLWDQDSSLRIGARVVQLARNLGALESLAVADNAYGQAAVFAGDFTTASLLIAELEALKDATDTRIAPHAAVALAGFRGREAEAQDLFARTVTNAEAEGQGTAMQYVNWARSTLMNGLCRYDDAREAAEQASNDTPELFISAWATSELVEAAARSGRAAEGRAALKRFDAQTEAGPTDWALGLSARAHAQLDEGETAELLYREAIDRLGRTQLRPELARSHLLYGEWLRRERRRIDARAQLHAATRLFETTGMQAFAERARTELGATGATVRKRVDALRDELTPQERQIARLARDGLSNPEIGAQLFLSPRTVEWHLSKVFAKLGIRSRVQLSRALGEPDPAAST